MATTESEIMSMGMRLAAQGAQVGMTEAEILALSGTMSSLGIEAEMGGTAMTKILKKMQSAVMDAGAELSTWAEIAQMSKGEFEKLYNESAIDGLDAVVKGLNTISSRGENLTDVLEDMGIKGVYESDVLLRMSGASDLLSSALDTSTTAWKENTALSDEAAQRYATTESQIAMFKNTITDMAMTIGGYIIPVMLQAINAISPWIEKFGELDESIQSTIIIIAGIAAAIGPILMFAGTMISSIGSIIGVFGKLATAIKGAGGVIAVLTNPIGLTVAAIGLIVGALIYAYNEVEWFRGAMDVAWVWIKESTSTAFEWIKGIVEAVMGSVGDFIGGILSKITDFWGENTTSAITIVEFAFGYIMNNIMMTMGIIQGIFQIVWPIISETVQVAWALIQTVVNTAIDIVLGYISAGMSLLQGDWQGAWEAIEGVGISIWNNIEAFFSGINLHEIGANIIQGLIDGIGSMASAVTERIKSIADGISNAFKNIFQIKSPSRLFESFGIDTMLGYTIGFEDEGRNAVDAAESTAFDIVEPFDPGEQGFPDFPTYPMSNPQSTPDISVPNNQASVASRSVNHNVFEFNISGENAKDIAAEVRREVENIFARLNAVTE